MDIKRTSGKRVSASQRDSFTAQSNQTTIRKPWKSLATKVDVKGQNTDINSINAKGEIVGFYSDSNGVQHGFLGVPAR